jgi:cyclophilin family peptidyl-prolyl cis-trans isomerase
MPESSFALAKRRLYRSVRGGAMRTGLAALIVALASCRDCHNVVRFAPKDADPLQAIIETQRGTIVLHLAQDSAPRLCANFANLVERKFFDGLSFYRSSGVMRQAGNPKNVEGTYYNPGYRLLPEFSPDLTFATGGQVAMLLWADNSLADLRQTEFFITVKPQDRWTLKFPIFATVTEGAEVVLALQDGDEIHSIRLSGNAEPLLRMHAELVETWNDALNKNPPAN